MGSKWKRVIVADVCTSIVDCVNKTAPVVEYPTDYKMIRTPNIRAGKVTLDGCRYVEKEVYETWTRRSKPQKGDVLLTREAPLGEVGIITTDENIFLGQRIMQYRADKNKIDPYFLLYSFLSPDLQQQFSMHEGSGSVVSHIRVGDCSKFEINIPPLEIQRSIVEILKSLDDHIDVNIKINQTLEQMSQTLFKSWFVDFDPVIDNALDAGNPIPEALQSRAELRQKVRNSENFKPLPADIRVLFPAEFEETELGYAPKGWMTNRLENILELAYGKALKRQKEPTVIILFMVLVVSMAPIMSILLKGQGLLLGGKVLLVHYIGKTKILPHRYGIFRKTQRILLPCLLLSTVENTGIREYEY